MHIARGLYYGSYKSPRILVWSIGVIILIVMMAKLWPNWEYEYKNNLAIEIEIINNGNTPYCGSAPRRAPLIEKLFTKESTEMTAYRNRAKMLSDLTKVANKYSYLKSLYFFSLKSKFITASTRDNSL